MKTILTVIVAVCAFTARAQDTIVMRTGTRMAAHVLEVGIGEIRCQRTDVPDSTLYIIAKSSVLCIRYAGGICDTLERNTAARTDYANSHAHTISRVGKLFRFRGRIMTQGQLYEVLRASDQPTLVPLLRKEKIRRRVGKVMIACGIPMAAISTLMLAGGIISTFQTPREAVAFAGVSVVFAAPAIALISWGSSLVNSSADWLNRAILEYNRGIRSGENTGWQDMFTEEGGMR